MKKKMFFGKLLLATMMSAPLTTSAQVTIGSGDLPQATLDIVGSYSNESEKGKAFRLDDGNQFSGRVLTCQENGVGTWQNSGVTIVQANMPQPAIAKSVLMRDYPTLTTIFVDNDFYIDLAPGKYMVFTFVPIYFNFHIEALESVRYRPVLTTNGTAWTGLSFTVNGPVRANTLIRNLIVFTLNVPPSDTPVRYYVGYSEFVHANSNGTNITTNTTLNPNTATNEASFIRNGVSGHIYAVSMQ